MITLMCLSASAFAETWQPWEAPTAGTSGSAIDLRHLNESTAGVGGRVRSEGGHFVLGSGERVRFWGVNGPPESLTGEALKSTARELAARGVNLVRVHGAVFDRETGTLKPEAIARFQEIVAAMKAEGIYTHLSIYFPLWMTPKPGLPELEGYDGTQHPFAALMFNPDFQKQYQGWWRAILTTPGKDGAPSLLEDPAVFGLEIQNEDSLFFWTFNDQNVPPPQRQILQKQFGSWIAKRYGDFEKAFAAWENLRMPEDDPEAGRLAFRPLFQIFTDKTPRDRDTARFLYETQRDFYENQIRFVRGLGFDGLITASNWITANDAILGPFEKLSYTPGDFIDRHGYWGGLHQGENAAWSIREGHKFANRSALRFDPEKPDGERVITHPVFDTKVNGLPSMISETTFPRPNRYRTEAPVFYAAYAALQGSNSIVHFALDGGDWVVKPQFWMQPWTLMSPTQMGQFPAAALIYRLGLVREGDLVADVKLPFDRLFALEGSPLSQTANLDELRKVDVGQEVKHASSIDPRVHLIGRTALTISENPGESKIQNLAPFIDAASQIVTSSTGELRLDPRKGVLILNSDKAQGVVGNLALEGAVSLPVIEIRSDLDLASILLVPLDSKPLESSNRLLLQVMSEEQNHEWKTEGEEILTIKDIGRDPWEFRPMRGSVTLKNPPPGGFIITPLDTNGHPAGEPSRASELTLQPNTVYYLIERAQ